jgi:hypothetical protein
MIEFFRLPRGNSSSVTTDQQSLWNVYRLGSLILPVLRSFAFRSYPLTDGRLDVWQAPAKFCAPLFTSIDLHCQLKTPAPLVRCSYLKYIAYNYTSSIYSPSDLHIKHPIVQYLAFARPTDRIGAVMNWNLQTIALPPSRRDGTTLAPGFGTYLLYLYQLCKKSDTHRRRGRSTWMKARNE